MKSFSYLNLAGILALTVLCAAQWRENRQYNQEINRLEGIRIDQSERLDRQDTAIREHLEDIETLKSDILGLTDSLRTTEGTLRLETQKADQLERDQERLKQNIAEWRAAVEARDSRIKDYHERIGELAEMQNEAVARHNELAEDYNELVNKWNESVRRR